MKAWRIDADEAVPKLSVKASAKRRARHRLPKLTIPKIRHDKETRRHPHKRGIGKNEIQKINKKMPETTKLPRIMRHPVKNREYIIFFVFDGNKKCDRGQRHGRYRRRKNGRKAKIDRERQSMLNICGSLKKNQFDLTTTEKKRTKRPTFFTKRRW